jgi:hypothetical protein
VKIRWSVVLTTAALVFWLFAAVSIAQAQECPANGWLLGDGPNPNEVHAIAHGSLDAWQDGWTYAHEGHFDRIVLQISGDNYLLHVWSTASGEWVLATSYRMSKANVPCLYYVQVQPGHYLFLGVAPALVEHEHAKVEEFNAEPQPMKKS